MRKLLVLFLTIILIGFTGSFSVKAQESDQVKQAREDYLFQFAQYTQAHQEYKTAKEAYQKFQTITAQQEAIAKTKEVLLLRAEVVRTHLQLLKVALNASQYLDTAIRDSQFGKIEATQAFLETHKSNVANTKSVAEVNAESQRLEREAPANQILAYETLSWLLIGKTQELHARTQRFLDEISKKPKAADQAVTQGIGEVKRKLTEVRVNIDRANQALQEFEKQRRRVGSSSRAIGVMTDTYATVKRETGKAKATLEEATELLRELERLTSDG